MSKTSSVLNLILSHQSPTAIARMLAHWSECVNSESILIAYGGTRSQFEEIQHPQKFFVDDPRLRTSDHQREFQSYTRLFRGAAEFLNTQGTRFQFVYFAEYDHIPLVTDLNGRQEERLRHERADVIGYHLHRIDGSSSAHFLYHAANAAFNSYWEKVSRRANATVILSMFGTGSFWTKEAFCRVAAMEEPFPIYTEIYLPTLAHHLGFRIRDIAEQNQFVRALPNEIISIERARKEGAWTLHPIKGLWSE